MLAKQKGDGSIFNRGIFTCRPRDLVEKSDPTRSLFTVWLHAITGRAAIVVSNVSGEECIVLVASEAQ